jgi:hypothetical protein
LIDRTRYWRRGELLVFKAELEAAKARGLEDVGRVIAVVRLERMKSSGFPGRSNIRTAKRKLEQTEGIERFAFQGVLGRSTTELRPLNQPCKQ